MKADAHIQQFSELARAYCLWAEGATAPAEQEARLAIKHLVGLFGCALELPELYAEEEAEDIGAADRDRVFKRFSALPFNYYSQVFNPLTVPSAEPVVADLADDLTDIWRDIKPGLKLYDAGFTSAAVWEWRNNFNIHWGHHAAGAIFSLHCWLANAS